MAKTTVTFLIDRSSSMGSIRTPTIEGFNEYIKGLKEGDAAEDTEFTFLQFDSISLDKVYVDEPVKSVPDLNTQTYVPRGSTPLIEACIKTIKAREQALNGDTEKKVVITFMTDGHENCSHRDYTWEDLNALIKEKSALGWQFNFLGVGIDAYDQGLKMGISVDNTMSATMDAGQMKSAYRSMGMNAAMYASGAVTSTANSLSQKMAAGDYTVTGKKVEDIGLTKKPPAPSVKVRGVLPGKTKFVDDFDLKK